MLSPAAQLHSGRSNPYCRRVAAFCRRCRSHRHRHLIIHRRSIVGCGVRGLYRHRCERQQAERQSSKEHSAKSDSREHVRWWSDTWALFFQDTQFRDFVIVRSLMLVSALSTSFIVALSHSVGNDSLSGLAASCWPRVWHRCSAGSSLAGFLIFLTPGDVNWRRHRLCPAFSSSIRAIFTAANQLLLVTDRLFRHQPRTHRHPCRTKDLCRGHGRRRSAHLVCRLANTLMGVVLLLVGGVSAVIAVFGNQAALLFSRRWLHRHLARREATGGIAEHIAL